MHAANIVRLLMSMSEASDMLMRRRSGVLDEP
jgi:hypothetical protein